MSDPDPEVGDEHAYRYCWPKIQITDFGVAVELRPEWQNPQDITGRGTDGYTAPEQQRQIGRDQVEYPLQQLSSKTNIWGIGAVLYDLMNPRLHRRSSSQSGGPILEESPDDVDSRIGFHDDLLLDPNKRLAWCMVAEDDKEYSRRSKPAGVKFENAYSDELVQFVTQCLAFRPEDRPDLEEMEIVIDENLEACYHGRDSTWTGVENLDFETKILKESKTPIKDEFAIGPVEQLRGTGGGVMET